ncbi:MAG TPA: hypothetical protein VGR96_13190 [Acidobacteriaceae bacterium]|nr:hypothetical protein [Acidobacteriaceae bacterium]
MATHSVDEHSRKLEEPAQEAEPGRRANPVDRDGRMDHEQCIGDGGTMKPCGGYLYPAAVIAGVLLLLITAV